MTISMTTLDKLRWISKSAFSTVDTICHTYEATVHALTLQGCLVECGVAAGAQIGAMCQALNDLGQVRPIHLFDSFQGIPFAGPKDADQPGIGPMLHDPNAPLRKRLASTGIAAASVDVVKQHLTRWGFASYFDHMAFHEGWFQDTLPQQKPEEPIALLRLDGDLYESTECCLNALYDQVVPGAVVIVDDYGLPGCRQAVQDYFARTGQPEPRVDYVPDGGTVAYWTK